MGVLLFLVVLVVLIVGHEFGHLLAAKRVGMEVPEFGIGFPPKLWSFVVGATEYSINALPFGGFVRIIGENGDTDHPNAFSQKSKVAQVCVLAAGPVMNIVLAFFAFWIAFTLGLPQALSAEAPQPADARTVVTQVLADSPAEAAGLRVGDELIGFAPSEEPMTVHIVRDGNQIFLDLVPVAGVIADEPERKAIGVGSLVLSTVSYGFFESFVKALDATWRGLVSIVVGFAGLIASVFTLSASLEGLSGPVGIASLVGDAAVFGAGQVLVFAAIISLNLAVLNLLPFPALDGGRIALVIIETIRGRAIRTSTAQAINTVGFVLLIGLMLVVTWHDILKL